MSSDDVQKQNAIQMALQVAAVAAEHAYDKGLSDGVNLGSIMGYVQAINDLKPALSDGLRHGSPECGKAMRTLRKLGALDSND